jgi:catechol 2,3-dioxygenase-like lactoylglutathione lyase family enzyme
MNATPAPAVRMQFASVRIITDDLDRLVAFYEQVTGVAADRPDPALAFAEVVMPWATLAIGHSRTVPLFAPGAARAADNHSVIIEFQVEDVDAEYARLKPLIATWVQEPTTLPWGNRSILFRDPDGNLVNLYTPVTDEAIARFSGRTPSAI